MKLFSSKWMMLWLIMVGATQQAYAYTPPAPFILKTWVNKHATLKSARIRSMVTAVEQGKPTAHHFKETMIYQSDSRSIRFWASDENDIVLFTGEHPLTTASVVAKLLFSPQLAQVSNVLKENGFLTSLQDSETQESAATPTESPSGSRPKSNPSAQPLERLNGRVAWVIPGESQIWFEKDSFFPMRLLFKENLEGGIREVRFENYRFQKEYPFPRTLQLLKKDADIAVTSDVIEVQVNLPHVKTSVRREGFTEAGESAPKEVKELIQQYYGIIR